MAEKVRWKDSTVARTHANECAVSVARGEFVVSFGVREAPQAAQTDVVVQVVREVSMTPYVAKNLAILLDRVLREYEARYGQGRTAAPAPGARGGTVGAV